MENRIENREKKSCESRMISLVLNSLKVVYKTKYIYIKS
jgi:hypothetical protein